MVSKLSSRQPQASLPQGRPRAPLLVRGVDLRGTDLRGANLGGANLYGADLSGADLSGAMLGEARLVEATLRWAMLVGTDLGKADLQGADLRGADLGEAKLSGANLQYASLVNTRLANANLTGCRIYGMSAWDLHLEGAEQADLIITRNDQPEITVDNLEVAQFIYLLLNNERIRHVIDTITSKVVLILGRFTPERKAVLDALREELRRRNLLPIVFGFSIPAGRDVTETVKVLAGLARFVIADVTDATEVRAELHHIVPNFPSLPIQPILLRGRDEFVSMSGHLAMFPWMLPTFEYEGQDPLLANLDQGLIEPAEVCVRALEKRRRAIEAELAKPS